MFYALMYVVAGSDERNRVIVTNVPQWENSAAVENAGACVSALFEAYESHEWCVWTGNRPRPGFG